MNWLNEKGIRKRATTEEFAKDSYENLLYSICRYHEFTGKYELLNLKKKKKK